MYLDTLYLLEIKFYTFPLLICNASISTIKTYLIAEHLYIILIYGMGVFTNDTIRYLYF